MPLSNWDRFKTFFVFDTARLHVIWHDLAAETLRKLGLVSAALLEVDAIADEAVPLAVTAGAYGVRAQRAEQAYNNALQAGDKAAQSAAVEELETVDGLADALLKRADALARANVAGLQATEEGRDLIDGMMEEIDWSDGKQADLAFGQEALKARFQIDTIQGKLGRKALPRLYALLKGVPEDHVRDNDRLKVIDRQTPWRGIGGCYRGRDNTIVITMKRSAGPLGGTFTPDADDVVADQYKPEQTSTPVFNHVTLHEVGHAYDASANFMNSKLGQAAYGGWELVSAAELGAAFGQAKGFFAAPGFQACDIDGFLQLYLESEARYGDEGVAAKAKWDSQKARGDNASAVDDISEHAVVLRAKALFGRYQNGELQWPATPEARERLAGPFRLPIRDDFRRHYDGDALYGRIWAHYDTVRIMFREQMAVNDAAEQAVAALKAYDGVVPPWTALAAHEAAKICRLFNKSESGLWIGGAKAAQDYAIGAYSYTSAGDGIYYRYLTAQRAFAVTKYQWRAPAEWFAELYALHFAGKMKTTHPAHALFLDALGQPFAV